LTHLLRVEEQVSVGSHRLRPLDPAEEREFSVIKLRLFYGPSVLEADSAPSGRLKTFLLMV